MLAASLAVVLGAWFLSGWADVRARQASERAAPVRAAERRGAEVVESIRGELASLLAREVIRPYFHYQNLFRDPRTSAGTSVAPSPLAGGDFDPLVRGYFQIDRDGRATTPTINDDVPELSEPRRIAEHRAFRDEVARSLARPLAPARPPGPLVASAEPTPPRTTPRPSRPPPPAPKRPPAPTPPSPSSSSIAQAPPARVAQVVTLDRSDYVQNAYPNLVFQSQRGGADQPAEPAPPPSATVPARPRPAPRRASAARPPGQHAPAAPAAPTTVTIIVSPLEWQTHAFEGAPALVAVRHVDTPDGQLTQGFVIDRAALIARIAAEEERAVLALRAGDVAGSSREDAQRAIVPGWYLDAAPHPRALAQAAAAAAALAPSFVARFAGVALLAVLAGTLVVWLVARAERLARERSQFAAAAAHELRTPLAGLQLYGDMLADGLGDPDKQRDYARRMSEEASRLGRVVSNVLGFSQLERGNLTVDARPGRLDDVLRELAERAEPVLDRAGAVLAFEVTPGLTASFDRDALARIVGNLVDNAEKYSRGADDRTITLAARAAGDAAVEITVSDRGPGVPRKLRSRMFRPFTRGAGPDAPAGLGLGLVLSRSLARAMGGELALRDDGERGATFVLRLVRARDERGATPAT